MLGSTTIATVPSGERWILRESQLYVSSAAVGAVMRFAVRAASLTAYVQTSPVVAGNVYELVGRFIVADEGSELRVEAVTAVYNFRYHVSGYKLELP